MNITSPLAFKLIFKYRIRNRFNLLKPTVFIQIELLWGRQSELSVCSFCSPKKPQLEILTGQERRKRDYAEGASLYFLVIRIAKRLGGIRLSSCFPVLCKRSQHNSQCIWVTLTLLDGTWIYLQSHSFYTESLIQVGRERPITAMHLHHKISPVHGSVKRHFPATATRRVLFCLLDNLFHQRQPGALQLSEKVANRWWDTLVSASPLGITAPCPAFATHSLCLAWLVSAAWKFTLPPLWRSLFSYPRFPLYIRKEIAGSYPRLSVGHSSFFGCPQASRPFFKATCSYSVLWLPTWWV